MSPPQITTSILKCSFVTNGFRSLSVFGRTVATSKFLSIRIKSLWASIARAAPQLCNDFAAGFSNIITAQNIVFITTRRCGTKKEKQKVNTTNQMEVTPDPSFLEAHGSSHREGGSQMIWALKDRLWRSSSALCKQTLILFAGTLFVPVKLE